MNYNSKLSVYKLKKIIRYFWSFTKRRLAKLNGGTANFELHLKECEWRWNQDVDDSERQLWSLIK